MSETHYIKRAEVIEADEERAVAAFAKAVRQPGMAGVIFFCSSEYDPARLSAALNHHFQCPVIGCTSAGEIGTTYQNGGIVGISFSSDAFVIHPLLFQDLDQLSQPIIKESVHKLSEQLVHSTRLDPERMFAYMLIDGLSLKEEVVVPMLYRELEGVQLLGGSAGDELKFKQTLIFCDGAFHQHAAVMALIETRMDFEVFKLQHFEPSEDDLVITESIPNQRIVLEIDGSPAAAEYANIIGLNVDELTPLTFSMHPVMLEIGDEWYVRSIEKINADGSLTFYCAIDNGLPLTLARSQGLIKTLQSQINRLHKRFSCIDLTLGCDGILRRLELIQTDDQENAEDLLKEINFSGFSTFGEQYNGIHVNQTMVGVVLGEKST